MSLSHFRNIRFYIGFYKLFIHPRSHDHTFKICPIYGREDEILLYGLRLVWRKSFKTIYNITYITKI